MQIKNERSCACSMSDEDLIGYSFMLRLRQIDISFM